MRLAIFALTAVGLLTTSSTYANTISFDDARKISAISGKVMSFGKDLSDIGMSLARSSGPARAMICFRLIQDQTLFLGSSLYGAMIATEMSKSITDPADENDTLPVVKVALELVTSFLSSARSTMNQVVGGCARENQLAYDKAKSLMNLIEEASSIVSPTLRRVEAAMRGR